MDKWIPVNGTYRGGIELLDIHRYLIPIWYQSLGIRLSKVIFQRVDSWLTRPPGFGASQKSTRFCSIKKKKKQLSNNHLDDVCFFYLMLNKTFFEFNVE